jgi:hypothetical protein
MPTLLLLLTLLFTTLRWSCVWVGCRARPKKVVSTRKSLFRNGKWSKAPDSEMREQSSIPVAKKLVFFLPYNAVFNRQHDIGHFSLHPL